MGEIERCLHCGATAQVIEEVTGFPDELEYFVLCDDLECEIRTSPHSTREEAIAAWNRRAGGWIKCNDELPKKGQECWVTDGTYVLKTRYPDPIYDSSMPYFGKITHWMPAQIKPEPPEATDARS